METNFGLNAKCLRKDEPLEACNNPECRNVIHPSCLKKVMSAVAENEWEGLLFCGKQCFNNNKKVLEVAASKYKGRFNLVGSISMVPNPSRKKHVSTIVSVTNSS